MKTTDIITKHFIEFLKENKLTLSFYNMTLNGYFIIVDCPENKLSTEYDNEYFAECAAKFIENTLMDTLLDKQHNTHFTNFIAKISLDKELHPVIAKYIYSQQYSAINPYYDDVVLRTLNFLTLNPALYFTYVKQTKFLDRNLKQLTIIFPHLNTEQKEELIQKCFSLKTLKSLESQTFLFNLIQKNLANFEQYNKYFPNIRKINNNEQFIGSPLTEEVLTYNIPIKSLNAINLEKEYTAETIMSSIKSLSIYINKLPEPILSLNITNTEISKVNINSETHLCFKVYGNNLQKNKINYFLNRTILITVKEGLMFSQKDSLALFKESLIFAEKCFLHDNLQDNLSANSTTSNKKRKI